MKTTKLPSVEDRVKQFRTRWGRFYLQRDIRSIDVTSVDWKQCESTAIGGNAILTDILENVVKPLYGKE